MADVVRTASKAGDNVGDVASAARRSGDDLVEGGTTACRRSFSADTRVLMADGRSLAMDEVEVGDQVWATDPETGEEGAYPVVAVWPHEDSLLELELSSGSVTTTEDHEFWNVTDQAWQESQHLDTGDQLLST